MASLTSAQLIEITDREFLGILQQSANDDGFAEIDAIAQRLGIDHPNPRDCVRGRLSWLKRWGMVENDEDGLWGLTTAGEALYQGRLKTAAERALQSLSEGERWAVTTMVTRNYEQLSPESATMIRREFQHHVQNRRLLS